MKKPFPPTTNFHALSLKDLLEARQAFHVHLAHKENVVATAVGLYRIRRDDPDSREPQAARARKDSPPRTLANSAVRPWSWPCILVFVDRWEEQARFADRPEDAIPRHVYMPDSRVVPICVVLASRDEAGGRPIRQAVFPSQVIGGGYPVLTDGQGQSKVGSLGCLVTDGEATYALTNRHVTGRADQECYTLVRGTKLVLGKTDARQTAKLPFAEAYPGLPGGGQTYCNLDAGLIRLDDLGPWTAQVYGIGEVGEPVDLNTDTLSLNLIGCPVRAYGAASGQLAGEVQGLFYRYKSVGGVDYVADLLIGPRDERTPVETRPGDSGTLWFYDPPPEKEEAEEEQREPSRGKKAPRLRPLALEWGGHRFVGVEGEEKYQFALATCVSTILRVLDVEVVRGWNIGLSEYWGKFGHYKIAASACSLPSNAKLRKLMTKNLDRIAYADAEIQAGGLGQGPGGMVPLADVADLVWKNHRGDPEKNAHFADMDEPGQGEFEGQTLLSLCKDHPENVDVKLWNRFYSSLSSETKPGALPFRVGQIYQEAVKFLRDGKLAEFLCAAGIMAHYVGDACQPLHVSRFHHGVPGENQSAVHEDYESKMLDKNAAAVVAAVNEALNGVNVAGGLAGGKAVGAAVVGLMQETFDRIDPMEVVNVWAESSGHGKFQKMWEKLGERTAACMASGCKMLASIWQSAWEEGGGDAIPDAQIKELDPATLKAIYTPSSFLKSLTLAQMESQHVFG